MVALRMANLSGIAAHGTYRTEHGVLLFIHTAFTTSVHMDKSEYNFTTQTDMLFNH